MPKFESHPMFSSAFLECCRGADLQSSFSGQGLSAFRGAGHEAHDGLLREQSSTAFPDADHHKLLGFLQVQQRFMKQYMKLMTVSSLTLNRAPRRLVGAEHQGFLQGSSSSAFGGAEHQRFLRGSSSSSFGAAEHQGFLSVSWRRTSRISPAIEFVSIW